MANAIDHGRHRTIGDWRMRISLVLTAGWLTLGFLYISSVVGWSRFANQNAPSLGSFLEGAFAPLAFLWLVVGFFLQHQQLHEHTRTIEAQLEEMKRTAVQSELQSRAIAANELHARQDTFLSITKLVSDQLGMIAGWIVTSYVQGRDTSVLALWERMVRGESATFSLEAMRMCFSESVSAAELFHGSEIRHAHSMRFVQAFDRMAATASDCDPLGMIEDALREGPHGRIHRMIRESDPGGT